MNPETLKFWFAVAMVVATLGNALFAVRDFRRGDRRGAMMSAIGAVASAVAIWLTFS